MITNLNLKRRAPGHYESRDYPVRIVGFHREETDDYGPAGEMMWYYLIGNANGGQDVFYSKSATVRAALADLNAGVR